MSFNSTLSPAFFALLEKLWNTPQATENANFQQLLLHILLVDNQQLYNIKCEEFVKKVLPKVLTCNIITYCEKMKEQMTSDVTQKILTTQSKQIKAGVELLEHAMNDQDTALLETAAHNFSSVRYLSFLHDLIIHRF
jgi:hypothetical protein